MPTPTPVPMPTPTPGCTGYNLLYYVRFVDNTDKNQYMPDIYVCHNFSRDLISNLRIIGYDAHMVIIHQNGYGEPHAIVAVFLPDNTMALIEPQTDQLVNDVYDLNHDGLIHYYEENSNIWVNYNTGTLEGYGDMSDYYIEDGLIIVDVDYN
jgi:hypothetical protein